MEKGGWEQNAVGDCGVRKSCTEGRVVAKSGLMGRAETGVFEVPLNNSACPMSMRRCNCCDVVLATDCVA
jgi:hypothetical protein